MGKEGIKYGQKKFDIFYGLPLSEHDDIYCRCCYKANSIRVVKTKLEIAKHKESSNTYLQEDLLGSE